jgi:excisionase family DNA binding protein
MKSLTLVLGGEERAVNGRVPTVASPYLTSREAVDYLKLPSLSALYTLIREHALPAHHRGRLRLFDVRELDAWVRRMDPVDHARQLRDQGKHVVGSRIAGRASGNS